MRYLKRTAFILFISFASQIIVPHLLSARRTREAPVKFFKETGKQPEHLNRCLLDFVLGLPGVTEISFVSEPVLLEGDAPADARESSGVYRFDVLTNRGVIGLAVKPTDKKAADDFKAASFIGVSPGPVMFITNEPDDPQICGDGYLVYVFFEGVKLSKICSKEDGAQTIEDNIWIIEQLGAKLARLKKAGIVYKDFLYYNTIINFQDKKLAIIDFGDMNCADPAVQVESWWIPTLFNRDPEFREKAIDVFKKAYSSELPTN